MSLATRCNSCGIVFRVVQDQLKVSEGWVRCGRCDAVFNALEGLFDLDLEQPPEWQAPQPPGSRSDPAGSSAAVGPDPDPANGGRPEPGLHGLRSSGGSSPSERVLQRDRNDFEDARFNTELILDDDVQPDENALTEPAASGLAAQTDAVPAAPLAAGPEAQPLAEAGSAEPGFLQQADRDARWQHPALRKQLWWAAGLFTVSLALQSVHHFRDGIAARWPAVLPAMTAWCGVARCAIEAPRRIQDLSLESSGLTQTGVGSNSFKLSVTLRNRGKWMVLLPAIELSVSDINGQLVARKALRPADFGVAGLVIQPGADLALQLTLASSGPKVSGYTVELFYP